MIRVAYIIDDLGLGGAQRQLVELLKGLARTRYEVHVISLSTAKTHYADALRSRGIPLHEIPQSGTLDWRCLRALVTLLKALRPSIVHTWLFTADLYGRVAACRARVPVIVSAVRSVEPDKPWHYVAADRLLRRVTHAFTVNAEAIGQVLAARERVSPARIHTIYNGVDLGVFDSAKADGAVRRRVGVDVTTPLIGMVGRFAPVKDHATFLRAAAVVRRELPHARFLLVGDGPLKEEMSRLSRALGLKEHVHMWESQSDIAAVFAALDVVVVSSRYEGCCNVILEAMAMGKPVVATAVGGNPELVGHEQTGLLVPPADPMPLAEAIARLVRDPRRAHAMGQAARRRVEERFGLSRMVHQTQRLYDDVLAQATP